MSRKLTKKQRGFIQDYAATGNGTKSALKNYDTKDENTAAMIASDNLTKPKIQLALKDMFDDNFLAEKHRALLNKKQTIHHYDEVNKEPTLIRTNEIDSYAVKAGLELAYKIKGSFATDKVDVTSGGLPIQISEAIAKKNKLTE